MTGRTGRVSGTRELVIPNTSFIAAYAIVQADIVVLAVYHGAHTGRRPFKLGDNPTSGLREIPISLADGKDVSQSALCRRSTYNSKVRDCYAVLQKCDGTRD